MHEGTYLKLVALDINGLEARIIEDRNVKDIDSACDYFSQTHKNDAGNAIWLILHRDISGKPTSLGVVQTS